MKSGRRRVSELTFEWTEEVRLVSTPQWRWMKVEGWLCRAAQRSDPPKPPLCPAHFYQCWDLQGSNWGEDPKQRRRMWGEAKDLKRISHFMLCCWSTKIKSELNMVWRSCETDEESTQRCHATQTAHNNFHQMQQYKCYVDVSEGSEAWTFVVLKMCFSALALNREWK